MSHDNDYHDDINYGNRFPDDWYFMEEIDVTKTLESNKELLNHPYYN
jgi:hypothetical protein